MENTNVVIRILPAEGCNPEFAPGQNEQEGMELAGYVLLGFDEEKDLVVSAVNGLSAHEISEGISNNWTEQTISVLRQSMAVAEGTIKAMKIFEETMKRHKKQEMYGILELLKGGEDDDEAGD